MDNFQNKSFLIM